MRPIFLAVTILLTGVAGLYGCAANGSQPEDNLWRVRVVAAYPHDATAFTQGLTIYGGRMYEGTGLYGASSLRRVDIKTGRVEQIVPLDRAYFGEGIAVLNERIYQFTWLNGIAIVYDVETFTPLKTVYYGREAWGLTDDGTYLIVSDGTATVRFLDPETLQPVRDITVHSGAQTIDRLNELEYVQDEIWANIWFKDRIVRISPRDGEVLGWIDLSELHPRAAKSREDVLNGIAFDAVTDRVYVTGKNWPLLYEIKTIRP